MNKLLIIPGLLALLGGTSLAAERIETSNTWTCSFCAGFNSLTALAKVERVVGQTSGQYV